MAKKPRNISKLLTAPQAGAIVYGLRLLQNGLRQGCIAPNDRDVVGALTSQGQHPGLTIDEIESLLAEAFGIH